MFIRHAATALVVISGSCLTYVGLLASFGTGSSTYQLIPNGNAVANGCRDGGPGGINRTNPSWVRVVLNDHRKKIVEGLVAGSHVTYEDFPFNHDSHDMNSFIVPDPPYVGLMSDVNKGQLSSSDPRHMLEVEWESKYYPISYWPVTGDRAWVIGRHIFDCGHPPYRTEIHPPVGAAYTRSGAMILPGDSTPLMVNRTFIFFGNQGGYFVDKVGGTDYVFNVPFPPKPVGGTPRFLVLSRPSGGMPPPVLTPKMVGNTQMLEVRVPLSAVPDPTVRWDLYEQIKRGLPTNNRPTNVLAYGAVIATSWTRGKTALLGTPGFRMVRVQFQNIKVHNDHDVGGAEWNMYVRANHEWIKVPEREDVDDGDTIPINQFVDVFLPDNGTVEIQCTGWEDDNDGHFRVGSPPGIGQIGALNENKLLPEIIRRHPASQNFGIGQQSINANPRDYTLNYTITELRKFPGTPGATIRPGGGLIRPPARTTGGEGHK